MKKVIYIPDADETLIDAELAAILYVAENYENGTNFEILAQTDDIEDTYTKLTSAY